MCDRGIGVEKKKKINWRFNKFEYRLMEEYLYEMAIKGWFPSEIHEKKAIFVQTKPRQLKFCVNILTNLTTTFHNGESDIIGQNKDSCERLGWHFITSYDQIQFYYVENYENTYPIKTDLELEQKLVIDKELKKEIYKSLAVFIYFSFILVTTLYGYYFRKGFIDYKILVNWTSLLEIFLLMPLAFIITMARVISNVFCYLNVKSNIGLKNNKKSLRLVKLRNVIFDVGDYLLIIISILILLSIFFSMGLLYNWKVKLFLATILVFIVCNCYFYFKAKEINSKKVTITSLCSIIVGIVVLVYILAEVSLYKDLNRPKDMLIISDEYPVIKITDFSDTIIGEIDGTTSNYNYSPLLPLKEEYHENDFNKGYSPLVPISYNYYESYKNDYKHFYYTTTTEYYKCINSSVASIIYEGILDEYKNKEYYIKDIKSGSTENWNCDRVILLSSKIINMVLLLKDNEIIRVDISVDLVNVYDNNFREKVLERFMKYNE